MQWGLGGVVVIGGARRRVMIPPRNAPSELAERDLAAAGDGEVALSDEYRALSRRLATVGSLLSLLVLVTILFMAIKPGRHRPSTRRRAGTLEA